MAAASQSSLSFAATVGQLSAGQTVTISNSGTESLAIGTITSTGDSSDFPINNGCRGATLAQGATCSLQVGFAPTVAGSSSATLVVPSNDPKSPLTVALSGTATPAVVSTPKTVSTKATVGDQQITLTTPSLNACVATGKRLAVSLKSTKRSTGAKLTFSSAAFYIGKGVAHTKRERKGGKSVKVTTYTANATERHVPVSVSLTLPKLKAGTDTLKVIMAYKETVTKHGHKKTVTVTKTLTAKLKVC
jgi:hypothetical protein